MKSQVLQSSTQLSRFGILWHGLKLKREKEKLKPKILTVQKMNAKKSVSNFHALREYPRERFQQVPKIKGSSIERNPNHGMLCLLPDAVHRSHGEFLESDYQCPDYQTGLSNR